MPNITFLPANITVELPAGASLLEGARLAGVFIETPCGGKGSCQKCLVRITDNREQLTESANQRFSEQLVLICQTAVPGEPITVELLRADSQLSGQFENFEDPAKYLPEKREMFEGYVQNQIGECEDLGDAIVGVTWILRKEAIYHEKLSQKQ